MYVLIGEFEGDYGDFYQRYREAIATSDNKKALEDYKQEYIEEMKDETFKYIDFDIEEVPSV